MRVRDGRYECALCGAVLDLPLMAKPRAILEARSGRRNVRILNLDGREIHRCELRGVGADARRRVTD